jgi:hypothetical protein
MSKHSWDYRRHGPLRKNPYSNWRLILAVPLCIIAPFIGIAQLKDPATCDGQPMTQSDRCLHHGRSHETLIVGAGTDLAGRDYSLQGQIIFNRFMGVMSLVMGASGVALGAAWTRHQWLNARARREYGDRPPADTGAVDEEAEI